MESAGTWATETEIMATANLLNHDIVIYCKSGHQMLWMTYPASFTCIDVDESAIYLENISEHFNVVLTVR